jgi:serine protease Do
MKRVLPLMMVGIISALVALGISHRFQRGSTILKENDQNASFRLAGMSGGGLPSDAFIAAARISTPAVVHIDTEIKVKQKSMQQMNPFWQFFGDQFGLPNEQQPDRVQQGMGSGVIISNDGYIVTNNHVVENADVIHVHLNDNREFEAKVVGSDPSTDLAVIKIEASGLQPLTFGNSDQVEVGQWVLAVGNPFNLASTVTAGIVSAKARNINILREKAGNLAIESFIQTDAAVNPGNSGGALVDLSGNLIGINSAIATPTGVYAGYSFAIPSNLVKKIVKDIIDFGLVQRGFLGVNIREVDDELAKDSKLSKIQGAYVVDLVKDGAAASAGLKPGDVITKVENAEIKNTADLTEHIARYRPGETVQIELVRAGQIMNKSVVLRSKDNTTALLSKADAPPTGKVLTDLGIDIEDITSLQAKKLGVPGGVRVKVIRDGIIKRNTQIEEGFIITSINNLQVTSVKNFEDAIKNNRGQGILLQGKYEDRTGVQFYAFGY